MLRRMNENIERAYNNTKPNVSFRRVWGNVCQGKRLCRTITVLTGAQRVNKSELGQQVNDENCIQWARQIETVLKQEGVDAFKELKGPCSWRAVNGEESGRR